MDALISLLYTIIDSVCVCLFLDAFASRRWRDHRFLVGVIVQTILMYASIEFSVIALNRNQIVKILLILLSCFIVARTLYENISGRFLLFLIHMKQSSHKTAGKTCSESFTAVPVVLCVIRPTTTISSRASSAVQTAAERC